jgi:putative oxidoreductase
MEQLHQHWASVPLRLAIGLGCVYHGWHNVIRADERQAFLWMLEDIGITRPHLALWLISAVSVGGGLALLAGAFVRVASVALAVVVPAILFAIHWPSGFDFVHLAAVAEQGPQYGMPGYEVSVLYLAGLLALFLAGSGPYSIDAYRRHAERRVPGHSYRR